MSIEFTEDTCIACGTRYTQRVGALCEHQCVPTKADPLTRSIPASVFSDLGAIGDRLKHIQHERES